MNLQISEANCQMLKLLVPNRQSQLLRPKPKTRIPQPEAGRSIGVAAGRRRLDTL